MIGNDCTGSCKFNYHTTTTAQVLPSISIKQLPFIITELEPSWSYGSWIYNYLCNRCLSSLKLWVWTPFMARCTRLLLKWSKIVWYKRSRYFSGTIQQIALTLWPKGVLCYALHTRLLLKYQNVIEALGIFEHFPVVFQEI
jgi:hypothetical protein